MMSTQAHFWNTGYDLGREKNWDADEEELKEIVRQYGMR